MSVKIKIKGKSKIQEFARFVAKTYSPMMGWLVYDADSREAWTTYCAQGQSELQVRGNQHIIAKEGDVYKAHGCERSGEERKTYTEIYRALLAAIDDIASGRWAARVAAEEAERQAEIDAYFA